MIYFDNAATTYVDKEILDSFVTAIEKVSGNSSSLHKEGIKALVMEQKARKQIASFFNAEENDVLFTSGATESNNLAIRGVAFKYQNRGRHIITTKIEHLSVLETLKQLEELFNFEVTYLDVDENGVISIEDLKNNIRDDTILVSVMSVNNEVGSIQPIEEIGRLLKQYPKIYFHVDATQSIGKININYDDVDLLSLSGHKIHSFKSFGILLKRKHVSLLPMNTGGGHQNGYRSGTTNVPAEIAIAKAIRFAFENQKRWYEHALILRKHLVDGLSKIEGISLNSNDKCSPFIISFAVNKKASVVQQALSDRDIYVSTKSACSSKKEFVSYVLEEMKKDKWVCGNSLRVSFSHKNTIEEIDVFIKELKDVLKNIK